MKTEELKTKLERLTKYLLEIGMILKFADKEIQDDPQKLRSIERVYQLIVDEAIDINVLFLSGEYQYVLDTYRASFEELSKRGVLSEELTTKISGSVKLRNDIVHEYEFLQKNEMIKGIRKFVALFAEYVKLISQKI